MALTANATEPGMEKPPLLPRILIADQSRIARVTIAKLLRDRFDVREEGDGEAAWQLLVLDQSIQLVICSLSLPVFDGNDLLIRVRSSRLARLRQMPMLMICGDDEPAIERARCGGASDFISRSTGPAEMLARVESLLKLAQAQSRLSDNLEENVRNAETGLFTRKYIETQALASVAHALRHGGEVSAIVIGFDHLDVLREAHGDGVAWHVQQRFAALLASKVRQDDSLGHLAVDQLVVISPATSCTACESFANRLREAIYAAQIVVDGQRLNLSVSLGVSNIPVDTVVSGGALIELAGDRLAAAQQAGGNRVVSCPLPSSRAAIAPRIDQAVALIRLGRENEVVPHLAALGRQLLPLLKLLEKELGLPLADIEKCLLDPARDAKDAGQD